jgi:tetratricopeptide (TPR) repeat protein
VALTLGLVVLGEAHVSNAADKTLITRARSTLYTHRDTAIAILEDAVARNPEEVVYWVELILALDLDDGRDNTFSFADRASRHALTIHPRHPELLIARARLRRDGVGLEVLAELAKVPGYERQAERFADLLTCSLFFPETDPWPLDTITSLADRLVVLGRCDAAARYVDEGLRAVAGQRTWPLLARRAMLAALDGEHDRAMKLHRLANGYQVVMEGTYHGLADVLLVKNRPDLAIASFGDQLPTEESFRRLLAMAQSRSNHIPEALRLLDGDGWGDQLLRLRVLLSAGRTAEAELSGLELVAPMERPLGSSTGPWIRRVFCGPRALMDDYLVVVRWLNDKFERKRLAIGGVLGRGTEEPSRAFRSWSPVEPISRTIERLEAAMRNTADAASQETARRRLSDAYARAGRYGDAADLLARSRPLNSNGLVGHAWVCWSMLRRQAEALAASERGYSSLAAARSIVANVRGSRWNHPRIDGRPWLRDDEVVARLVAIGPAVLADVMARLGPNTISGEDRRPWVAVIEKLGAVRDVPVLIATLALVTRPKPHPLSLQNENDRLTAEALEGCLRKLTGAEPEGANRAFAWSRWWAENAARIAAGMNTQKDVK